MCGIVSTSVKTSVNHLLYATSSSQVPQSSVETSCFAKRGQKNTEYPLSRPNHWKTSNCLASWKSGILGKFALAVPLYTYCMNCSFVCCRTLFLFSHGSQPVLESVANTVAIWRELRDYQTGSQRYKRFTYQIICWLDDWLGDYDGWRH